VKPKDEIKEVEKLEDTKIGTINQEGAKDEGLVAPPVEKSTGVVQAPKVEEDYDKVFTVVQIPAEFPGGLPAWQKYLERNLNRDLPVENGAPPGKYTVVVSFIVSKTGDISDVQAENDPGYGTKAEAIRVIQKGPKWKPAVQNGRQVIYRHKQAITFVVSED
jgi:protein TonB